MKRRLVPLLGAAALALSFGAGQAAAEEPGGAAQGAGQSAMSGQQAGGDSGAYQSGATNSGLSIRVLSPGSDGNVTQSNNVTSGAIATNDNNTSQKTDQSQSGGGSGSNYGQVAGQAAENKQSADAAAKAVQIKPTNGATSIRVLSPGSNGDVNQSNEANAGAVAANDNETKQSVDQDQTGGSGSDYAQIAGQSAENKQKADADAKAVQLKPSNDSLSIRVLSPGDDGDVTQSNSTTAGAAALNDNETKQSIDQEQGSPKSKDDKSKDEKGKDDKGSEYTQIAGQSASNKQDADADAKAVQVKPSNTSTSIRVLSKGDNGDVTQSNDATALAAAKNDNETKQSIDQEQGGSKGMDEKSKDEKSRGRQGLGVHPDRRAGRIEQAGRRCRREGGSAEAEQRGDLDPRAQQGRRR